MYGLIAGGIFAFLLAIIIGMALQDSDSSPWAWPATIIVTYLLTAWGVTYFFKLRSNYEYRMSQFLLAVFCRAENNKLYLRNGIEMRPGYLGRWIEFTSIDCGGNEDIIQHMRERFLKPSLEYKAARFQKEIDSNPNLAHEQASI